MDAFDRGAQFYELFANAPGRLNREAPFLQRILESCPGNRVADVACGTGLHALFFAELGARVHAYDLNSGMIEHARKTRPHPHIHYAVHDMRVPLDESFDAIVCLGNSLSLLGSPQDLEEAFDAIHTALAAGGRFIAQIVNYALPSNQTPRCRVEERIDDDAKVVAVKCLAPHGNRTYLTLTYFAGSDNRMETVAESAVLAHWSREDLAAAAETAGLAVIETLGGFDGQPFDSGLSNDLILVCERRAD